MTEAAITVREVLRLLLEADSYAGDGDTLTPLLSVNEYRSLLRGRVFW